MKLSRLKLIFSSLVLMGYATLGFVAFILFFTKKVNDLEVVLVLSPYTAIAGAAQGLFNDITFGGGDETIYGFEGKQLRSFFRNLSQEITSKFTTTHIGVYLISSSDFYSIMSQLTRYCIETKDPEVEDLRAMIEELFLRNATGVIGELVTEGDIRFYVQRIGDWLDENRTFEPNSVIPAIASCIVLIVAIAYPFSGIVLLFIVAFFDDNNFTPQDVGLIAGIVSGLFASYWTSTIHRLSGQQ